MKARENKGKCLPEHQDVPKTPAIKGTRAEYGWNVAVFTRECTHVSAVVVAGLEEAGEESSDVGCVGGDEDDTEGAPHVDQHLVRPRLGSCGGREDEAVSRREVEGYKCST